MLLLNLFQLLQPSVTLARPDIQQQRQQLFASTI